MKINAINTFSLNSYDKKNKQKNNQLMSAPRINNTAGNPVQFKGFTGKVVGGGLGGALSGLVTLASLANPAGVVAALVFVAAEVGGAVIGGAIGGAITKDDDE